MRLNYDKIFNNYLKEYDITLKILDKKICIAAPYMGRLILFGPNKPSSIKDLRGFLHEVGHNVIAPPFKVPLNLDIFKEEIGAENFCYKELDKLKILTKKNLISIYSHVGCMSYVFKRNLDDYEVFKNIILTPNINSFFIYNNNIKIVEIKASLLKQYQDFYTNL